MTARDPGQQVRRVAGLVIPYLITVYALVTLNFLLPRALPGDPVEAQLSVGSPTYVYDDKARAELTAYYRLDRPLIEQYGDYLDGLVHGDLGRSTSSHTPVSTLIRNKLPWTLLLAVSSMALATVAGVIGGVIAGWRRDRRSDRSLLTAFIVLENIPSYVVGSLLLLIFSVELRWFPLSGNRTLFASYGLAGTVVDVARHLALPATVLAAEVAGFQFLLTRASMVTQLGADYLVLGRVKGLSERRLKYRHAARNALLPVVGNTAVQLAMSITVMVFVERIFVYPGIGRMVFDAIGARDYPVIQGGFLIVTIAVLTLNLLADVLYRRLDPRAAQ